MPIKVLKIDELLNHSSEQRAAIDQSAWPNCAGHACDDDLVDILSLCVLVGLDRRQPLVVGCNRHCRRGGHLAIYPTNDFVREVDGAFIAIGAVRR